MDHPLTLKIVSLGLIIACVLVIVLFIIFVHRMPGKIARRRNNPQAEAIEILSLLGLLIFPLWMAALVWAYVRPFQVPVVVRGGNVAIDHDRDPGPKHAAASDAVLAVNDEAPGA
jgi:hypothetical protein